jgi:hypothetical protein
MENRGGMIGLLSCNNLGLEIFYDGIAVYAFTIAERQSMLINKRPYNGLPIGHFIETIAVGELHSNQMKLDGGVGDGGDVIRKSRQCLPLIDL